MPAIAAILLPLSLLGQDTITIGTGAELNGLTGFPAPYGNIQNGSRHQMLILASELQAAGMSAGEIQSIAFEVSEPAFVEFMGFTISLGTTDQTAMTPMWIGGLTPVWGPTPYINDQSGWNEHVFDAPYTWDGTSNLVVQTCYANTGNGVNAIHMISLTPFTSTLVRSTNNQNVCTSNFGQLQTYDARPNVRFVWSSFEVPPVAAFTQSTTSTCTGTVQFTDQSAYQPDSWAWDFGDGTTDTVQNPSHDYTTDGVFTPTLIVTNAFGSDTIAGTPISVSVNGPLPVSACVPASTGTIAGFGILNVSLGTDQFPSGDAASEGYADRSCQLHMVTAGSLLDISVATAQAAPHNIRAWADWDNSGDFSGGELILSANSTFTANASILVPVFAVLNTPLRLRVIADYDLSPFPAPCAGPQYGQAEDYALLVEENTAAPVAIFTASTTFSCDGVIQFTDGSLNIPTSWTWDFGDGEQSNAASPAHTYLNSGTYTVTLTVTNANGSDMSVQTDLIVVDLAGQLLPASCIPNTTAYCCGFGITGVQFAGISNTSPDGIEGYVDRSCGNTAQVDEGALYPIAITTGGTVAHDVFVWMDLDNSGTFEPNEAVWSALDAVDPSGNLIVPAASVFGVPVRMRITGDVVGEVSGACDAPLYGQTEDYSVIISPNPNPPSASFTANPTSTCTGFVQFTDQSLNAPESWSWDFGDGTSSTEQSPLHEYLGGGTFTVALTVTNPNGSDTETAVDLITVVEPPFCDTLSMPGFGPPVSTGECTGVLTDDGGPDADYTPGPSAPFTISVPDAEVITLTFSQFEFETNFDFLRIFDGPDNNSPEIGNGFSGSGIGSLPNNGVITSSGNAITLQQDASNGPTTWEGFVLVWDCSYTGVPENASDPIGTIWPQPAQDRFTVSFSRASGNDGKLVLRDALGAAVRSVPLSGGQREHSFDATGLAPGPYLLSLETAAGRWNRTIIIR